MADAPAAMVIDLRVEVPSDIESIYTALAKERGTDDVEMLIGLDLQGVIDSFFDNVVAAEEREAESDH